LTACISKKSQENIFTDIDYGRPWCEKCLLHGITEVSSLEVLQVQVMRGTWKIKCKHLKTRGEQFTDSSKITFIST